MNFIKPSLPVEDFGVANPVGGWDFLLVSPHDIRLHACSLTGDVNHPMNLELPVVFYETIAKRYSKTSDLEEISYNLPLPIVLRGKEVNLNEILETFPGIIARAAWLADENAKCEDFNPIIQKTDLEYLYSESVRKSKPKDLAPLLESFQKFKGWNEEANQIRDFSTLAELLRTLPRPKSRDGFKALPSDYSENIEKICE
jgi:hypothetical protein